MKEPIKNCLKVAAVLLGAVLLIAAQTNYFDDIVIRGNVIQRESGGSPTQFITTTAPTLSANITIVESANAGTRVVANGTLTTGTIVIGGGSSTVGNTTMSVTGGNYISSVSNVQINNSTLTYSTTPAVDFSGDGFKTITLAGDATFSGTNYAAGRSVTVRIVGDGSTRNLAFDSDWIFVGAAAPSTIAANKVAILTLTSFTNADTGVVAAYSVQP